MDPNYYVFAPPLLLGLTTLICIVVFLYLRSHRYLLWFAAAQALLALGLALQMQFNTAQRLHYSPYTTAIYLAAISCLAQSIAQRFHKKLNWLPIAIINALTMAAMWHVSTLAASSSLRLVMMSAYVALVHALVMLQLRHSRPQHVLDRISVALYGLFGVSMLLRLLLLPLEISTIDPMWISRQVAWWITTASVMLLCVGMTASLSASAMLDATLHLRHERDVDSLTGVLTRRAFEERCGTSPYAHGLRALVLADIDHFKYINDQHGHAVGDAVLRHIGQVLQRSVRTTDVVGRVGGEEFALALHALDLPQAEALVARIAQHMRTYHQPGADLTLQVTGSFGLVMLRPHESLESAMQRADELLYQAKTAGRDCIRSASI